MQKKLLIVLFFLSFQVNAQNRYNIDSLNQVLETTPYDSVKINSLTHIFDNYLYSNDDSARISYEKMLAISKAGQYNKGFYTAYLYKSTYYWTKSKFDSVLVAMNMALDYALQMKDDTKISNCYVRLAMVQSSLGNYDEAKSLTLKALDIAKKNNDWQGLYYAYYRLGNTYYYENNFEQALVNYLKVDSIFEHHERKEPALAAALSNIGAIYMEFKEFEKSEEYFIKSKNLYRDMNREEGEVYAHVRIGQLEFTKENYQKAIEIFVPSLAYYTTADNKREMADLSGWLAGAYLNSENFNEAETYYKKSAQWAIEIKNKFLEANAYVGLAEIAQKTNKPGLTINYLSSSLKLYEEMDISYNKSQIFKNLATAYDSLKDYRSALHYYQNYHILSDSIAKKENQKATQEIETKYQTQKKEREIVLLKSQNELIEQQKANQRNLLLAGIGFVSLAGLFFFFLSRNKQKTNTRLKELDTLKSNFFANISHEFRTPLTLISAPIQQKLAVDNLDESDRSNFEMIQRNNSKLLTLVDQLLDLSKIEAKSLTLQIENGNVLSFIGAITDSLTYMADQKGIDYVQNIETTKQDAWFDKDAIEKISVNLLYNALKYTPENGSIVCNAFIKEEFLCLEVRNTGKGLTEEQLKMVFERFYQVDEHQQGSGIGLALVKELVSLHKGNIAVESEPGGWTTFKVTIPVDKKNYKGSEFKKVDAHKTISTLPESNGIPTPEDNDISNQDLPILLIVEDNADVQTLLKSTFEGDYSIISAMDGQAGIELALENIPDLIISDVMMPVKDGIALTKTLKNDERTSHIPIVLLTAKAGDANELKGVETGADDYITKPFNSKLLTSKVAKLIELRKQLQSRYSQEVILKPKDIAITPLDEQFLEKVQAVLDEQLVESSFNIEQFSKAVAMSRMQLHRKLKALTGLSASEFIKSQRLKLAAQLLEDSDTNVSQVGYAVGFNDHSYFTKCFKELYNSTPSEYAKRV
ncbi:response regulator [Fulvivirgaceae bacterium BMA10]|uniref:histidine kinase n=1 Tax=Splendidivirga corallicola TaxID=3051826 RepID=A0ABT8KNS7_9BACT|nr:response regulator [Fulvivirgaceae bacterium BMA10]